MFGWISQGSVRSASLTAVAVLVIGGTSALAATAPSPGKAVTPSASPATKRGPAKPDAQVPAPAATCHDRETSDEDAGDQAQRLDPAAQAKHDAEKAARKAKHDADKAARKAKRAADKAAGVKSENDDQNDEKQGGSDDDKGAGPAKPSTAKPAAGKPDATKKKADEDKNDGLDGEDAAGCSAPAGPAAPAQPAAAPSNAPKPSDSPAVTPSQSAQPSPTVTPRASNTPSASPGSQEPGRTH